MIDFSVQAIEESVTALTVPPRRTPSYMLKGKGRDLPETEFKRNVSIAHLSITCVLAMEVLSEVQCVPFHIVHR